MGAGKGGEGEGGGSGNWMNVDTLWACRNGEERR